MIPKFFGRSGRELFGVYHPSLIALTAQVAVVLCYPGPQEYRQCHFAYRNLAGLLARAGLHVLRFDYFATGDSAGDSREGTLDQWVEDIGTAVAEVRDLSGLTRVALVGMRLGACLAARATKANVQASRLVLWDPVVSGAEYLARLELSQQRMLDALHYPEDNSRTPGELLGYPLTESMRASLTSVDLAREGVGATGGVLMACATRRPEYDALHTVLTTDGVPCVLEHVPDASMAAPDWMQDSLLARQIPNSVAAFLLRGRE